MNSVLTASWNLPFCHSVTHKSHTSQSVLILGCDYWQSVFFLTVLGVGLQHSGIFLLPKKHCWQLKGCSAMFEIVTEIDMEQTRLFQCTLFPLYVDRLTISVIEIVTAFSDRAVLILKNSDRDRQESIVQRTQLFQCTLFHHAEKSESPSRSGITYPISIWIFRAWLVKHQNHIWLFITLSSAFSTAVVSYVFPLLCFQSTYV